MKINYSFFCFLLTLTGFIFLGELKVTNIIVPYVLAQAEQQQCPLSEKDSEEFLKKEELADYFYKKGIEYFNKRNRDDAEISLKCLENALNLYEEIDIYEEIENLENKQKKGRIFKILGEIHYFSTQFDSSHYELSIDNYEKVLEYVKEQPKEKSIIKQEIGKIYYELGQYEEAEKFQQEALLIIEKYNTEEEVLAGKILLDLANSHINLKDFQSAINRNKKALLIMEKHDNKYLMIQAHYQLGKAFSEIGEYDKAENQLKKAIEKIKQVRTKIKDHEAQEELTQNQIEMANLLQIVLFSKNIKSKTNFWLDQIVIPFGISIFAGILGTLALGYFGLSNLKHFIEDQERKKELGELKLFWGTPNINKRQSNSTKFIIVTGTEKQNDETIDPCIKHSHAKGIFEIQQTLEKIYGSNISIENKLVAIQKSFDRDIFEHNVVIVAGENCHEAFSAFYNHLQTRYSHSISGDGTKIISSTKGGQYKSRIDKTNTILGDYGTVTRITRKDGKLIILYNGNYSAGILGAIRATTNKEIFLQTHFKKGEKAQQLLTHVENKEKTDILTLPNKLHFEDDLKWVDFDINETEIINAIKNFK